MRWWKNAGPRTICCRDTGFTLFRLCTCSGLYAISVVISTIMFSSSTNYYLLHVGNAIVVVYMNQEPLRYVRALYPLCAYTTSFVALPFNATSKHILIASSANVVEQILMHIIMVKTLGSLTDRYLFRSLRFLQVLFFIALPFSFAMSLVGTVALYLSSGDAFSTTLLTYTASHVAGNYLGLYTFYVLRGFQWRQWPPKAYLRDLCIVCGVEILLNAWTQYGDFRQAATVQIYPLLAYIAARYNQCYTALADVLVMVIVLVAVVLNRGPYYTASTTNLSVFISLFIMLMYSACLTSLLSYFMQQRRTALNNVSRLKDELFFVSSQVSHDVRAPLTHVMSVCESLETAPYTVADLEEVKFSCQTIADIMDDWLLMLAESEKAANAADSGTSNTTAAVADDAAHNDRMMSTETLTVLFRKLTVYGNRVILLSGKPLTLHIVAPSKYNMLQFSNKMLQHVLINLVSNSIKYSQNGLISITAVFDGDKNELCVTVQDEGIGISQEHMPHLFDRFYRIKDDQRQHTLAADTTTNSFGVGLAIVQSLVTKMRGSITVTSEVGCGTVFIVTVPCHDLQSDAASTASVAPADVENQNGHEVCDLDLLSTARILLAEDNKICSFLFAKQLSVCASVTIIEDGALVMDAIKQCGHEVVLLDGTLPNQTGHQILTILQQEINLLSLVPVIVTITGGNAEIINTDWHPLTVEHCNKPFTKQRLLVAITTALRRATNSTGT
jgi:signal transduction histidine kinase/CheY-like chemotaxis protein